MVMVSDRQKGLIAAAASKLPLVTHGFCARHIKNNLSKHGLPEKDWPLFDRFIHAKTETAYQQRLQELYQTHPTAAQYIEHRLDPAHYSDYAFPHAQYGLTTSNAAEQVNAWILTQRSSNIVTLYNHIWCLMSDHFITRSEDAHQREEHFIAIATEKLESAMFDRDGYDVRSTRGRHNNQIIIGRVQPTSGSVDDCQRMKERIDSMFLVPDFYTTSTWRQCYSMPFPLFTTNNLEELSVVPPLVKKGRGRQKKKRGMRGIKPTTASQLRGTFGTNDDLHMADGSQVPNSQVPSLKDAWDTMASILVGSTTAIDR
ncbi:hypothetical protein I203_103230 [Kwoniella mangroviensis CBS 8507]|uniref:uncharacterized protein n=1 Tax=Kwoniella mangroviensis CBS 8507 TaxID=1296122 RepID=UPI00305ED2C3